MKLKMILVALILASSSALSARDLTVTTKTSGALKDLSTTYMSATSSRTNSPGLAMDIVTDFQQGITYIINHKQKTIKYMKLADLQSFAAFVAARTPKGKGMAEVNARMDKMYGDASTFKVENDGKETILGRLCNKTRITSGNLVWEYSTAPSIHSPIDPALTLRLMKASYATLSSYPNASKIMNHIMEAIAKLDGLPLKTRMSGFNGETDTEVTAISEAALPAGIFALPKGYAMTDQIAESEKAMAARSR